MIVNVDALFEMVDRCVADSDLAHYRAEPVTATTALSFVALLPARIRWGHDAFAAVQYARDVASVAVDDDGYWPLDHLMGCVIQRIAWFRVGRDASFDAYRTEFARIETELGYCVELDAHSVRWRDGRKVCSSKDIYGKPDCRHHSQ
jgi:hypothetical protein